MWQSLDMEASVIELMVVEMELVWEGDKLCVKAGAQVVVCCVSF